MKSSALAQWRVWILRFTLLLAAVASARPLLSDDPQGDKGDGKPPELAPSQQ
jgi:hypothetical protein